VTIAWYCGFPGSSNALHDLNSLRRLPERTITTSLSFQHNTQKSQKIRTYCSRVRSNAFRTQESQGF
jgi:hypothetical protein